MNVEELVRALKQYPAQSPVVFEHDCGYDIADIEGISYGIKVYDDGWTDAENKVILY